MVEHENQTSLKIRGKPVEGEIVYPDWHFLSEDVRILMSPPEDLIDDWLDELAKEDAIDATCVVKPPTSLPSPATGEILPRQ